MAGLTLGEFRWRYARAWERFVEAIAAEQPSERCGDIRALIDETHTATAPPHAASQIDAHVLDCPSCRVFARESYRALELLPLAPAISFAERWSSRLLAAWDRFGPEAAAGGGTAAATGTGASGLAGTGAAAGALKSLAVVCSATAVTAGVCGGVVVITGAPDDGGRAPAPRVAAKHERRVPTPASTASSSASSRASAVSTRAANSSAKPGRAIPASAPSGSREFDPSGSGAPLQPAPAPSAGGGEFGP
jgi:hypothetical protein